MSSIDEFRDMTLSGGAGVLDAGTFPVGAPAPTRSATGAGAPQAGPLGRGRAQVPAEKDLMARALRKESIAPSVRAETVEPEPAPPEGGEMDETVPSEPASPESGPPDATGGWVGILIQVLAIAVVAAGIALVALKVSGILAPPQVRVVTFDVLKYENAERAQAMKLMGQGGAGAVAPMLSYVSKRLHTAIERAAGPGTLVVLSQAVVQGQTRDITDQVLKELGLPTTVPTAAAVKSPAIGPSTMTPPVTASPGSPLSRLIESGSHTKKQSIIP
ncbi:MAG: hypothetical protein ACYCV6_02825 [Steroidobacteraceae bacterium]